jgi:hypothetical protein
MSPTLEDRISESTIRLRSRFRGAGSGADRPTLLCPADQGRNEGGIRLACGLLSLVADLKGFVLADIVSKEFDLRSRYGIDPASLYNLNSHNRELVATVKAIFQREHAELQSCFTALHDDIRTVHQEKLLGAQTPGKMAYVRDVTGVPLTRLRPYQIEEQLVELRGRTLELLGRQARRLPPDHPRRTEAERMAQQVERDVSVFDVLFYHLKALCANHPRPVVGFDAFCEIYRDEIAEELGRHLDRTGEATHLLSRLRFVRGRGLETAYARRDSTFITLGDDYGDCTAHKSRRQVDTEVANIHWTVYTWLLDPYYRILELYCEGEPVAKAHLVPLIIQDRRVLSIDAIEVVPKLRDYIRGQPNPNLSSRLFCLRRDLIDALFERTTELAERMGTDAVYVDKFSNASWVREIVDALPTVTYHVSEVEKPFGDKPIRRAVRDWLGLSDSEVCGEVQALNLHLMDQGLRFGYKEVAVLFGELPSTLSPVRGP